MAGPGWLPYVSDGETAGTTGEFRRIEALKVKLEDAPVAGSIEYRAHLEGTGWEDGYVADDAMAGTTGEYRRVEAVQMRLTGEMADLYDVWYRVHSQTYGWLGWACNDQPAGTTGPLQARRGRAGAATPQGQPRPWPHRQRPHNELTWTMYLVLGPPAQKVAGAVRKGRNKPYTASA